MVESHGHAPGGRGCRSRWHHGRELDEPLPAHQVDLKGRRHRIAAVTHTGNSPAGLGQAGIVNGRHQGGVFRQHVQPPSHHRYEEIVRVPPVAREQATVGRPIVGLASRHADQPGHGVPAETGELAERNPSGPFPRAMLPEGVHALHPEGLDLGQQL